MVPETRDLKSNVVIVLSVNVAVKALEGPLVVPVAPVNKDIFNDSVMVLPLHDIFPPSVVNLLKFNSVMFVLSVIVKLPLIVSNLLLLFPLLIDKNRPPLFFMITVPLIVIKFPDDNVPPSSVRLPLMDVNGFILETRSDGRSVLYESNAIRDPPEFINKSDVIVSYLYI